MASPFNPHAAPAHPVPGDPGIHVVFVPVDGRIVFWTCVLLAVFCLVEFGLRLHKGVQHDKDE